MFVNLINYYAKFDSFISLDCLMKVKSVPTSYIFFSFILHILYSLIHMI